MRDPIKQRALYKKMVKSTPDKDGTEFCLFMFFCFGQKFYFHSISIDVPISHGSYGPPLFFCRHRILPI
jgi:hypothetical protein